MFLNHDEYIDAEASEKIVLALIYPRKGMNTFTLDSGNIWKKSVGHVVNRILIDNVELTQASSTAVDVSNPWYYEFDTGLLWYYTTSTLPDDDNVIAEMLLHYSNVPLNLSYDLQDLSPEVEYSPRVISGAKFKSQIGFDQKNISIVGNGTLKLDNNDGYFDDIFDSFIWENKQIDLYTYNRDLSPSQATIQYKGTIVNKTFNSKDVSFKIQDSLTKLDTQVTMNLFTEADGVGPSFYGQPKRHIYGKLDGLLCRSVDQVGDGYSLSGTVSGTATTQNITGSGTSFNTDFAQGDTIFINEIPYDVEEISSDTALVISNSDGLEDTYSGESYTAQFGIPSTEVNREFFVADHAIRQTNSTVTNMVQLNRIIVADISGFEVGDALILDGADSFSVQGISGDQIQLNINADDLYPVGTTISKEPITKIYINGVQIDITDLSSLSNPDNGPSKFTLGNLSEFHITKDTPLNDANFTFAASDTITYAGTQDIRNILQSRDWIKVTTDADVEYKRIRDIVGNTIRLSSAYTGTTGGSLDVDLRRPDNITDDSPVSVNIFGKTVDNTATGDLITTGAEVVSDLLTDLGLGSEIDVASFNQASTDNDMRMAIAIPESISGSIPKVKDVINQVNGSIFGNLTLKQDFTLKYFITSCERASDILQINDDDTIKWSFAGKQTKSYKRVLGQYNFVDFDNSTLEENHSLLDYTSDRIVDYDISNKEITKEFYVNEESDAQELTERYTHYNEQILMELKVQSDLRLSKVEIGDQVQVNFVRMVNQPTIGDARRVFLVTGIDKSYDRVNLILSDLGNLYNRSAVIADDSTPDYSSSDVDDKRFNSYITDNNGLITGSEDSNGSNLIS